MEIDARSLSGTTWTDILTSTIYLPCITYFRNAVFNFCIPCLYLVTSYFALQNQQGTYPSEASEGGCRFVDAATDDFGRVYCCKYRLV